MKPEMDQDVVNLAKSIRQVESGGDFNAKGKSGESGAYQWMPETWKSHAKEALGNENAPMTPENQNAVAYTILKKRKDAGLNPAQIAAEWNSGSAKNWENKIGINKQGVEYNVPQYVKRVTDTYQQMKGQAMPQHAMGTQKPQDNKSLLRKAAEFAFPILEKKERTPLQTLGDIGLSALWFVPAVGPEASAGLRALGLGAKAAKIGATVGAGAATGYAADVSQKLSEGETGAGVLKPGIGTALGAGTAGIASKIAGRYSEKGVLESLAKENNAVFGQTKRGANDLAESFAKKKDPGKFLAEKGINIKSLVDPDTISYDTKQTASRVSQDASALNEILTNSLARVQGSRPILEIEQELLQKIPKNHPERADIVKREMQLLRQQYGETPSIADLNEWKQRNWGLSKFDLAVPGDTRLTHRMIGNYLKTQVQSLAEKGGLKRVDEFNDLIGSHLDAADMLETLHGTKAKGGRLGNLLMQQGLTTIGGVSGMFGGGPLGMIGGAIAGHYGAQVLAALIRKIERAPIKSKVLSKIEKEEPEIIKQFKEFAQKTPEGLQQLKQQLSQQGIDIFEEKTPQRVPTSLVPKESQTGRLQGLIPATAARLGTQ